MASVFHVAPVAGGWAVQEEGAARTVRVDNVAAAEQLALETAQALRRSGQACSVVVHAQDGSVRAVHEFPYDAQAPRRDLPPVS